MSSVWHFIQIIGISDQGYGMGNPKDCVVFFLELDILSTYLLLSLYIYHQCHLRYFAPNMRSECGLLQMGFLIGMIAACLSEFGFLATSLYICPRALVARLV